MIKLLIDIGNTSVKFGFFVENSILETYTIPSQSFGYSCDSLGFQVLEMLKHKGFAPRDVESVCVSSVVPALDSLFCEMCGKYLGKSPYFAMKDIAIPLENKYDNPKEVGADRLVGAYGARLLFPEAKSIISIDFGTATTFDCLEDNAYLGGLICPGILSSHSALSEKAAKLPRIALDVEASYPKIGKNTAISMGHGFVFGFAAMTSGLIEKLKSQLNKPLAIVATGGFAKDIAKHTPEINKVEPHLILHGLAMLLTQHLNKK